MNPDSSNLSREELEVKLTALLLGELEPAEATALRERLAVDTALAELYRHLEQTLGLVRAAVAQPGESAAPVSPLPQMSHARREQLLARLRQPPVESTPSSTPPGAVVIPVRFQTPPRTFYSNIGLALAACVVAYLGASMLLPSLATAKAKGKILAQRPQAAEAEKAIADQSFDRAMTLSDAELAKPAAAGGAGGKLMASRLDRNKSENAPRRELAAESKSFQEDAGVPAPAVQGAAGRSIQPSLAPQNPAPGSEKTPENAPAPGQLPTEPSSFVSGGVVADTPTVTATTAPAGGHAEKSGVLVNSESARSKDLVTRTFRVDGKALQERLGTGLAAGQEAPAPSMGNSARYFEGGAGGGGFGGGGAGGGPNAGSPGATPSHVFLNQNVISGGGGTVGGIISRSESAPSAAEQQVQLGRQPMIDASGLPVAAGGPQSGASASRGGVESFGKKLATQNGAVATPSSLATLANEQSRGERIENFGAIAGQDPSVANTWHFNPPADRAPAANKPAQVASVDFFAQPSGGTVATPAVPLLGAPVDGLQQLQRGSQIVDFDASARARPELELSKRGRTLDEGRESRDLFFSNADAPVPAAAPSAPTPSPAKEPEQLKEPLVFSRNTSRSAGAGVEVAKPGVSDKLRSDLLSDLDRKNDSNALGFGIRAGSETRGLDRAGGPAGPSAASSLPQLQTTPPRVAAGRPTFGDEAVVGSAFSVDGRTDSTLPLGATREAKPDEPNSSQFVMSPELMRRYGLGGGAVTNAGGDTASSSVLARDSRKAVEGLVTLGDESRNDSLALSAPTQEALQQNAPPAVATPPPVPQPEITTTENAFSTFSLNVSDVSYKLAAASLEQGTLPVPGSIRTEEFINAFQYRDPDPVPGSPIAFAAERSRYPFAHNRDILRLAVRTAARGREAGRPLNLVLAIDNSGSMERADRVRILREAIRTLAGQLQPDDKISVVAFSRLARLWVDGLPGARAGELVEAVGNLTPEGGTNLEDALRVSYETALKHFVATGVNRVVMLTDGAANLGDVSPDSLQRNVDSYRKRGVALDCFGIGWEGYNDNLLETLSHHGDGRYGFVNTPEEAGPEFAAQLAGALQVAASDVKVQIEFNPNRVSNWRQVGYATHQLTKEQFRDNTVDAAEIGAAESGNALYVIEVNPKGEGPIATARVRYKVPSSGVVEEHAWTVPFEGMASALEQASPAMRLATTSAALAESLAQSPFAGDVTAPKLLQLMSGVPAAFAPDPRPAQFENMIRQLGSIRGN